jgi:predicted O-methyltransferase YrrM
MSRLTPQQLICANISGSLPKYHRGNIHEKEILISVVKKVLGRDANTLEEIETLGLVKYIGIYGLSYDQISEIEHEYEKVTTLKDLYPLLTTLEATADDFWNISRENAVFLSSLIRAMGAKRVLEVGTSNGYSTLWFAEAVRENGGHVTTLEFDAGRAQIARENFATAGLSETITLIEGDACQTLKTLSSPTPFDFVFLDAEKPEYAEYLRLCVPLVRKNGLIIGDDTISLAAEMPEYLELAFSHPELESVAVPIDDGVIISRKR